MDETAIARLEQSFEDLKEIVEENNRILHSMQRAARWSFWGKTLLWLIVLILPFIVLGPLIHTLIPVSYTSEGSKGLFGLPTQGQIQDLINSYKHASSTP